MTEVCKLDGVTDVPYRREQPWLNRHIIWEQDLVIVRLNGDQEFLHGRVRSIVREIPPDVIGRINTLGWRLNNGVPLNQHHVSPVSTPILEAKVHQDSNQVILTLGLRGDEKVLAAVLGCETKGRLKEQLPDLSTAYRFTNLE